MDPTEVASTAAGMISYCCCGVDTCAMHGAQHQRGATAFVCRRCQGEQPEGLHRQSGRRWTSERGRRAPRETPARRQEPAKRRWLS
ncbi:unnamed protein product [Trichogramma brassicae]|uniref:Uncharacterized protein n=1 Tax=Trichogramma brassicae TaxID=86971 RepID=A0A6H5IPU8_9HYME|nr:unnamed protein product [Trichogramma brassicae]